MPYELKEYTWDLTKEEQEQARYILNECKRAIKQRQKEGTIELGCKPAAFEHFKRLFYRSVEKRLNIDTDSWGYNPTGFAVGAVNISDNGRKLTGYRIEQV